MGKPYKKIMVSIISFTKYGASLSLEFKDILIKHNCNVRLYTGKTVFHVMILKILIVV